MEIGVLIPFGNRLADLDDLTAMRTSFALNPSRPRSSRMAVTIDSISNDG